MTRVCICVFMRPLDARACVWRSEGEMKSSRQRITDPGHVSGVAAAGPLSCHIYIYAVCENSVNNRLWINFFFSDVYIISHCTQFYIFLYFTRDHWRRRASVCVTTTVRWMDIWYAATVNDPRHPPTGVGAFFSSYWRYIRIYLWNNIIYYVLRFFFLVGWRNRNETATSTMYNLFPSSWHPLPEQTFCPRADVDFTRTKLNTNAY